MNFVSCKSSGRQTRYHARHESGCLAGVSSSTAVYEVRLTAGLPRESLDWMMAATRVHWFKSCMQDTFVRARDDRVSCIQV